MAAIYIKDSSIQTRIEKGLELQNNGFFDDAIKEYQEVLKIEPDNAEIHKRLGDAFYDKQNELEALIEYRESIRIDPNNAATHNNLGLVYYQLGLYSDAIKELKEALNIEPGDAKTLSLLSLVYVDKGKFDLGLNTAREALKIDPNTALAHFSLGIGYHNKNRLDEAEKEYLEALKLDSSLDGAKNNLELLKKKKAGIEESDEDEILYPYINKRVGQNRAANNHVRSLSDIINSNDVKEKLSIELITKLLLENQLEPGTSFWGALSVNNGQTLSKKDANAFFFFCIFDFQMSAEYVWDNCGKFIKNVLRDPDNLWDMIASYSLNEWMQLSQEHSLHRFPHARKRAYRIAREIVKKYDGDVRNIWSNQPTSIVGERIYDLVGGDAIPRMIMGALKDGGQIDGVLDVKPDIHVKTVLGRALIGRVVTEDEATILSRYMNPGDPWAIDAPLFLLGRDYCQKSKCYCDICYLQRECYFYENEVKIRWVKDEKK